MSEMDPAPNEPAPAAGKRQKISWDALAAIIAALVGFLALLVAAYTAHIQRYTADIQREQVRAQVWPYLIPGNNDLTQSLVVTNKGAGPAVVRSVQVWINGKPQADWNHVLSSLGLPAHGFVQTSLNHGVLSPGEEINVILFGDKDQWRRFHAAALDRMAMDICFCSALDDCWISSNKNLIGPPTMQLQLKVNPVASCPRLAPADVFNN
ncbi:MAG TPA: hypothetical protein VGH80_07770 [Xanthomonadaceae bacterium]|jgi:hypothetical protein